MMTATAANVECRDVTLQTEIESWVLESRKTLGDAVDVPQIAEYMKEGLPRCPAGGKYDIPPIGKRPTCSIHGDLLKEYGWEWSKWPQEMRPNN